MSEYEYRAFVMVLGIAIGFGLSLLANEYRKSLTRSRDLQEKYDDATREE